MIKVDVTVKDLLSGEIKRVQRQLQQVPRESLVEFKALTPRKTGNARRNTTLVKGDVIRANYSYAQVLDEGRSVRDGQMRGSEQAKDGMTKPFAKWYRDKIKSILGK